MLVVETKHHRLVCTHGSHVASLSLNDVYCPTFLDVYQRCLFGRVSA